MRKAISAGLFVVLTIAGSVSDGRALSYYVPSWLREEPLEVTLTGIPRMRWVTWFPPILRIASSVS